MFAFVLNDTSCKTRNFFFVFLQTVKLGVSDNVASPITQAMVDQFRTARDPLSWMHGKLNQPSSIETVSSLFSKKTGLIIARLKPLHSG